MYPSYFYRNDTQKFHFTTLNNVIGGWGVVPTTLLKLPKNWVIYIGENVY